MSLINDALKRASQAQQAQKPPATPPLAPAPATQQTPTASTPAPAPQQPATVPAMQHVSSDEAPGFPVFRVVVLPLACAIVGGIVWYFVQSKPSPDTSVAPQAPAAPV